MIDELEIQTGTKNELVDITLQVGDAVARSAVDSGICHLFVPHTTAGLTLNENWDPSVKLDILRTLDSIAPQRRDYRHAEGNSPAHVKAMLVGFSATVPVDGGRLVLGTWQGIYLTEFDGPRKRRVLIQVLTG